jgi:hypothetical protein
LNSWRSEISINNSSIPFKARRVPCSPICLENLWDFF